MAKATKKKATTKKKADQGHAAHTKTADSQKALDGEMRKPLKITMMGAGSGFTPRLICDVAQIANSHGGEFCLVDIDRKRLKTMQKFVKLLLDSLGLTGWKITATTKRREVLADGEPERQPQ